MSKKKEESPSRSGEGWDAAERVKWLLHDRWQGNRSAMAKAIQMSVTGLIKVVTGQQPPGRQLLAAIVRNAEVNAAWLLTGNGPPYTAAALPVADRVLPGPPREHRDLLIDEKVEDLGTLYSPTRYWLNWTLNALNWSDLVCPACIHAWTNPAVKVAA